jgi:hypothetical protein
MATPIVPLRVEYRANDSTGTATLRFESTFECQAVELPYADIPVDCLPNFLNLPADTPIKIGPSYDVAFLTDLDAATFGKKLQAAMVQAVREQVGRERIISYETRESII